MASAAKEHSIPKIRHAQDACEVVETAIEELRSGLAAMLGRAIDTASDPRISASELRIELGGGTADAANSAPLAGDDFEVSRAGADLLIRSGSERGLIHASSDLLRRLGARFGACVPPQYPRIEAARLSAVEPYRVEHAFSRRAFVSDIMTWNYKFADRLELHLHHDREFISWMARRAANAFSYIRHSHDTKLRIDELVPTFRARGIDEEYGGHVLQILMPREQFESHPEYFPAGDDGVRVARGNLCVASEAALAMVRDGALRYVHDYPENEMLHVWGADVWQGAWCRCGRCVEMPPQLQYMEVVNAIADQLGHADAPPVAYLAYHDTIEPHPGLRPLPNVWFEWAPRERCYVHAIDDPNCDQNPRYFESLKRYIDLFEGRGHVFEYYADAILWGGLGFATPATIAADMRAYHALGLHSVSCLTFGAYSVMAYPANLEAFVECARDVAYDPNRAIADSAAQRHPACATEMAAAYRAIECASRLVLDYAEVMRLQLPPTLVARKLGELRDAANIVREAEVAAERIMRAEELPLVVAEQMLWRYTAQVLAGLSDYLEAMQRTGPEQAAKATAALARIADAADHVRAIDLEIKGTWGAYDLEWLREMWLGALKKGIEDHKSE